MNSWLVYLFLVKKSLRVFLLANIWVRQAGQQGWQGRSIEVPTLSADIFAAPINKTNFHKKTGEIIDI
jgi:hypothetical protein